MDRWYRCIQYVFVFLVAWEHTHACMPLHATALVQQSENFPATSLLSLRVPRVKLRAPSLRSLTWSPALTWRGSSDRSTIAPTPDPCKHHFTTCWGSHVCLRGTFSIRLGSKELHGETESLRSSCPVLQSSFTSSVSSACVHVCVPNVCPKLAGIRRGCQIP